MYVGAARVSTKLLMAVSDGLVAVTVMLSGGSAAVSG
jgi:hypothetical protein